MLSSTNKTFLTMFVASFLIFSSSYCFFVQDYAHGKNSAFIPVSDIVMFVSLNNKMRWHTMSYECSICSALNKTAWCQLWAGPARYYKRWQVKNMWNCPWMVAILLSVSVQWKLVVAGAGSQQPLSGQLCCPGSLSAWLSVKLRRPAAESSWPWTSQTGCTGLMFPFMLCGGEVLPASPVWGL